MVSVQRCNIGERVGALALAGDNADLERFKQIAARLDLARNPKPLCLPGCLPGFRCWHPDRRAWVAPAPKRQLTALPVVPSGWDKHDAPDHP